MPLRLTKAYRGLYADDAIDGGWTDDGAIWFPHPLRRRIDWLKRHRGSRKLEPEEVRSKE